MIEQCRTIEFPQKGDERGHLVIVEGNQDIPRLIWKDMYDFSRDSVLLCFSNEHYDPGEYIRDYDTYLEVMREIKEEL